MSLNKIMAAVIRRVPLVNKGVYSFSRRYIDAYRGFSYDFRQNGEGRLVATLPRFLSKDAVVFDVGANKGAWARAIKASLPEARLHCFELSPRTYANLEKTMQDSAATTLNNIGLSDQAGKVTLRDYGENHGGNTLIADPSYVHKRPVSSVTASVMRGDDYCREKGIEHIDFLKIDVEGWEYFVLKGFDSLLSQGKIRLVQFEYGYTHADVHTLMKDFFHLFEGYGMKVGRLTPKGVEFSAFHHELNNFKSGPNFIACMPDLEKTLSRF